MRPHQLPVTTGRFPPGAIGHNRGVVRPNYAFMPPEGVLISRLPHFSGTIVRILAAPVLGAQFAQYLLEIAPGGGTPEAFREEGIQHFYYVLSGQGRFVMADAPALDLRPGHFAYVPPGTAFALSNTGSEPLRVLGLRKRFEAIGLPAPEPILSHRDEIPVTNHTGAEGRGFQFLLPWGDMRFDFEMNLMWFKPGAHFPDVETHVMEHGLYMLEGQGLYFLGTEWHEIWAGDFIWMGGYCPQQFYPTGFADAAYLLYKNVNRDVAL
ncbi:(S)-ureidoglycine aminohydrolase [Bosea sp. 2RAB26]|uniref:(S)-ureidoglycine aminohydrolase n=1 Tax=Bosea sp. 2RAB26 TaxID=3237476 RepID=UPI003F91A0DA